MLTEIAPEFMEQEQFLNALLAYGNDHSPALFELINERRRHLLGRTSHDDRVERRLLRPALVAVADAPRLTAHVGDALGPQPGMPRFIREVQRELHLRIRVGQMRQQAEEQVGAAQFRVEVNQQPDGLAQRLADAVRDVTKLRADIELLTPGTLPNAGKVIEDARSYQ